MARVEDKATGEDKPKTRQLTIKQQNFVKFYIELGNGQEAYRRAYNAKNMKDPVIAVEVNRLLRHPLISLNIKEARQATAEKHEITVDFLTAGFLEAARIAKETDNPQGLTGAYTALAKLHGQMIERRKVESDNRHHHSTEPVSPFDEFLEGATGGGAETEAPRSLPH